MKLKKENIFNNQGVTLLELTVSVALFSLTILAASSIFQSVVASQRDAIISQEMQENMRYSFEKMGKEIRTAQRDTGGSCLPSGNVYWTNGSRLIFRNYHAQCVCYYLSSGRLYVGGSSCSGGLPLTPQKIVISNLSFKVTDSEMGAQQAFVTMKMHINVTVTGKTKQDIDMQTTLSSRYYE